MAFVCEVCGRPAVVLIRDSREIEPVEHDGELYEQRVPEGKPHAFCGEHRRAPVRHPRQEPVA